MGLQLEVLLGQRNILYSTSETETYSAVSYAAGGALFLGVVLLFIIVYLPWENQTKTVPRQINTYQTKLV